MTHRASYSLCLAGLLGAGLLLSTPIIANADYKSAFAVLEGSFKGSGSGLIRAGGKKVRISCALTNKLSGSKLSVRGKCASSQGSRRVSGSLNGSGNKVSGNFFGTVQNARMTGSNGTVKGKSMTIVSSFVDEIKGQQIKVRQIIQPTSGGFQVNFYALQPGSKKYESAGTIGFKKK